MSSNKVSGSNPSAPSRKHIQSDDNARERARQEPTTRFVRYSARTATDRLPSIAKDAAANDQYPFQPYYKDPRDTLYTAKQQAQKQWAEEAYHENAVANVTITDDHARYLLDKQAQLENFQFEQYCHQFIEPNDPMSKAYFNKIFPEFVDRQIKHLDYIYDIAKKMAKINIRGAQSRSDYFTLWLVQTRRIDINTKLYDPRSFAVGSNSAIKRGPFSLKTMLNAGFKGNKPSDYFSRDGTNSWSTGTNMNAAPPGAYQVANRAPFEHPLGNTSQYMGRKGTRVTQY